MKEIENNIPFFGQLKKIRQEKNLDLSVISEKSRIQKRYLVAMEEGQFDEIPDIYDKLFFQTYVNFLGLGEELENKYFEEFCRFRKISEPQHTTTIRKIKTQAFNPKIVERLKTLYIAIPILLIILVIVIMALNSTSVSEVENESVKELSVRQVAKEIEQKQESEEQKKVEDLAADNPVEVKNQVVVGIKASEDTWLRVIKDKKDSSEYLLRRGNNLALSADSTMEFLIGKANGITMTVNSKFIGKLGVAGEVVSYLKITDKGVVAKRLKKIKPKVIANDTLPVN